VTLSDFTLKRSKQIHSESMAAARKGAISPSKQFSEGLSKCAIVAAAFNSSAKRLITLLIYDILLCAHESQVKLIHATKHFPIHAPIAVGVSEKDLPPQGAYEYYAPLYGMEVNFSQLIMREEQLVLSADSVSDEVKKMCSDVTEIYRKAGLEVMVCKDLFRIPLAYISDGSAEGIHSYARKIDSLRKRIMQNPIKISINYLFHGQALWYFESLKRKEEIPVLQS
jgi:hypothetical protein